MEGSFDENSQRDILRLVWWWPLWGSWCLIFAEDLFDGMDYGSACAVGMGAYLCVVTELIYYGDRRIRAGGMGQTGWGRYAARAGRLPARWGAVISRKTERRQRPPSPNAVSQDYKGWDQQMETRRRAPGAVQRNRAAIRKNIRNWIRRSTRTRWRRSSAAAGPLPGTHIPIMVEESGGVEVHQRGRL